MPPMNTTLECANVRFPDVCNTLVGIPVVPIPYPSEYMAIMAAGYPGVIFDGGPALPLAMSEASMSMMTAGVIGGVASGTDGEMGMLLDGTSILLILCMPAAVVGMSMMMTNLINCMLGPPLAGVSNVMGM